MKYMGSKARLVKHIKPVLDSYRKEGQYYVEPFGGGANMVCEMSNPRIYSDFNRLLSAFFNDAVLGSFTPPEFITRETYNWAREEAKQSDTEFEPLVGYIGICGSYGGRWFDGGYAGITETSSGKVRNYPKEAYDNVMKQLPKLSGCVFTYGDYKELDIPPKSLIYCDPPYEGTKEYKSASKSGFCSEELWEWCRTKSKKGHTVIVSEYAAPEDFECIWEKEVSSSLRANAVISGAKKSTEKLFIFKGESNES